MIYWNTPSSSISNLFLYPCSAFGGEIVFVLRSIRFNWEWMGNILLHRLTPRVVPPPPSFISLEALTVERVDLYAHILPPGRPIIIEVDPFSMGDTILGWGEIYEMVVCIWMHRASGTSGLKVEHLHTCHHVATWEKDPDSGKWEKVAALIQAAFRGGGTNWAMRMEEIGDDLQVGRYQLPRDWPCWGYVEGNNWYNQPPIIVFRFIPRRSAWFLCG